MFSKKNVSITLGDLQYLRVQCKKVKTPQNKRRDSSLKSMFGLLLFCQKNFLQEKAIGIAKNYFKL